MVETLSHVRECRELEERYESDFTTQILDAAEYLDGACVLEKYVSEKDQTLLLAEVSQYDIIVSRHKITREIGWRKFLIKL